MATGNLNVNPDIVLANRRQFIQARQQKMPLEAVLAIAQMQKRPRTILNRMSDENEDTLLIGQVTRTDVYDPVSTALRYVQQGADAISFFTDHTLYTQDLDDLFMVARGIKETPVIYQNYVINEYNVMAVRASDASALILYASLLEPAKLRQVVSMSQRWKMTTMIQVEDEQQLELANTLSPHAVCFGNHHSHDLVHCLGKLKTARHLVPYHTRIMLLPCLQTLQDVESALDAGVNAIIVGDALLNNDKTASQLRQLLGRS